MKDLFDWLGAILSRWQNWASGGGFGGAALILVNLYERLKGWSMPRFWYALIFVVFFVLGASFMVWKDQRRMWLEEHKRAEALDKKLDSLSTPRLSGSIEQVIFGYDHEVKRTIALMMVSVKNLGAPSIAQGFHLSLVLPDKTHREYMPFFIPEGYKLTDTGPPTERVLTFKRSMALEDRTSLPIQSGALVRGWVKFELTDVQEDVFGNSKRRILFRDILDRECVATDITDHGKPGKNILAFPGIEQPYISPPTKK
jgi:hypothetical protein